MAGKIDAAKPLFMCRYGQRNLSGKQQRGLMHGHKKAVWGPNGKAFVRRADPGERAKKTVY